MYDFANAGVQIFVNGMIWLTLGIYVNKACESKSICHSTMENQPLFQLSHPQSQKKEWFTLSFRVLKNGATSNSPEVACWEVCSAYNQLPPDLGEEALLHQS